MEGVEGVEGGYAIYNIYVKKAQGRARARILKSSLMRAFYRNTLEKARPCAPLRPSLTIHVLYV